MDHLILANYLVVPGMVAAISLMLVFMDEKMSTGNYFTTVLWGGAAYLTFPVIYISLGCMFMVIIYIYLIISSKNIKDEDPITTP